MARQKNVRCKENDKLGGESMGIYRTVCHKVEDVFVKVLSKKQDPDVIKERVTKYRTEKEEKRLQQKAEIEKSRVEQKLFQAKKNEGLERQQREREEQQRKEVELLLSKVMDNGGQGYSSYEYNEVKNNKSFFINLTQRVFEPNENALTFIFCEFDKASKKEIKGYLIPTNKRVLFVGKTFNHLEKFRYQTIINVNWFKDGFLERGLKIQYGKKRLEFDEIFDQAQMQRVGDVILNKATKRVI